MTIGQLARPWRGAHAPVPAGSVGSSRHGALGADATRLVDAARALARAGALAAAFFLSQQLSLALRVPPLDLTPIWFPGGVLLAALLLTPRRRWWTCALAAYVAFFAAVLPTGAIPPTVAVIGMPLLLLQRLLLAALLLHVLGGPPRLDDFRHVTWFVVVVVVMPAVLMITGVQVGLRTGWGLADVWRMWPPIYLAGALGHVLVTPLILGVAAARGSRLRHRPRLEALELSAFAAAVAIVAWLVVRTTPSDPGVLPVPVYLVVPLLLWSASRLGPTVTALAATALAIVSVRQPAQSWAPYGSLSVLLGLPSLQLFLLAIFTPILLLSAAVRERLEVSVKMGRAERRAHRRLARVSREITQRKQAQEETRHLVQDLRDREADLQESSRLAHDLTRRLITAQEEERSRIARDLHDDVSQQLARLAIGLSHLKRQRPEMQAEVTKLQERAMAVGEGVRNLSHDLHPGVLRHAGLVPALRAFCTEFEAQHGVKTDFEVHGGADGVPYDVALCAYRVTQEALHNVATHAEARGARVALCIAPDALDLTIADDGRGFDPAQTRPRAGLGLISLEERVSLLGGALEIDSRIRHGTELRARVPLEAPA